MLNKQYGKERKRGISCGQGEVASQLQGPLPPRPSAWLPRGLPQPSSRHGGGGGEAKPPMPSPASTCTGRMYLLFNWQKPQYPGGSESAALILFLQQLKDNYPSLLVPLLILSLSDGELFPCSPALQPLVCSLHPEWAGPVGRHRAGTEDWQCPALRPDTFQL